MQIDETNASDPALVESGSIEEFVENEQNAEPSAEEESTAASSSMENDMVAAAQAEMLSDISLQLEEFNSTYLSTNNLNVLNSVVDRSSSVYHYAYQDTDGVCHLYLSDDVSVSGSNVSFGDYTHIILRRNTNSGYTSYYYYTVMEGSGITFTTDSLVYTNTLDHYPVLGSSVSYPISTAILIGILIGAGFYILGRLFGGRK